MSLPGMKCRKIRCLIGVLVLCLGPFSFAQCEESVLGLNAKTQYDIYIGGAEEGLSLIRAVMIEDLREIRGVAFLVIRTDTFDAKRSEGLIAFHHIRAIIPSHKGVNLPVTHRLPSQ